MNDSRRHNQAYWERIRAINEAQKDWTEERKALEWIRQAEECAKKHNIDSGYYGQRYAEVAAAAERRRREAFRAAEQQYQERIRAEASAKNKREADAEAAKKQARREQAKRKREAERRRRAERVEKAQAERHCEFTLAEVGKELQVTRERIRQIESRALAKLRHRKRANVLRPFAGYEGEPQSVGGYWVKPKPTLEQLDAMPPPEPEPEPEPMPDLDEWSPEFAEIACDALADAWELREVK